MIDPQGNTIAGADIPTIPLPAARRRRWAALAAWALAYTAAGAASLWAGIQLGMEVAAR